MKNITSKILGMAVALGAASHAQAAIDFGAPVVDTYTASWSGSAAIPDNNGSGVAFALNFNDLNVDYVNSVSVSFTINGGYNGDVYAYLSHGDGLVVLLNRIGRNSGNPDGSAVAGFTSGNFSINSVAGVDVHGAAGALNGGYAPDGRSISPYSSAATFDSAPRNATFASVVGGNPNGEWQLFFADTAGGFSGTLTDFTVNVDGVISPVPEPVTFALGAFTALFGGVQFARWRKSRGPR